MAAGLTAALRASGITEDRVTVLEREPNVYASTYPTEIVTCHLAEGHRPKTARRLFCKYSADVEHSAYGHRGGVAYEAEVYRQVLQPLETSTPQLYGVHAGNRARVPWGTTWLFLECLDDSVPVNLTTGTGAICKAAHWIGHFHALNEARLRTEPMPFLRTYDTAYYLGWVRRTALFGDLWQRRFPWLAALCERGHEIVAPLLAAPPTIIHGELYPENVLYSEGQVHAVDWESAAIACGEIDLAALISEWPANIVNECKQQYQRARWPRGAPADFERTLSAAQLYLLFRWLGERPEWTRAKAWLPYFELMRSLAEHLGLRSVFQR